MAQKFISGGSAHYLSCSFTPSFLEKQKLFSQRSSQTSPVQPGDMEQGPSGLIVGMFLIWKDARKLEQNVARNSGVIAFNLSFLFLVQ